MSFLRARIKPLIRTIRKAKSAHSSRVVTILFRESSSSRETLISRGFSLIELAVTLTILAVLAGLLIPLGTTLMDSQRTSTTEDSLAKIYTAIVGNPKLNTYGYLGDVGDYPSN